MDGSNNKNEYASRLFLKTLLDAGGSYSAFLEHYKTSFRSEIDRIKNDISNLFNKIQPRDGAKPKKFPSGITKLDRYDPQAKPQKKYRMFNFFWALIELDEYCSENMIATLNEEYRAQINLAFSTFDSYYGEDDNFISESNLKRILACYDRDQLSVLANNNQDRVIRALMLYAFPSFRFHCTHDTNSSPVFGSYSLAQMMSSNESSIRKDNPHYQEATRLFRRAKHLANNSDSGRDLGSTLYLLYETLKKYDQSYNPVQEYRKNLGASSTAKKQITEIEFRLCYEEGDSYDNSEIHHQIVLFMERAGIVNCGEKPKSLIEIVQDVVSLMDTEKKAFFFSGNSDCVLQEPCSDNLGKWVFETMFSVSKKHILL